MNLNEEIKDSGLFFPVDPGPSVCASITLNNFAPGTKVCDRHELAAWSELVAGMDILLLYLRSTELYNSGTNAVRYGTMKDWVINLTVVLADGSIIKTRRRPRYASVVKGSATTNHP